MAEHPMVHSGTTLARWRLNLSAVVCILWILGLPTSAASPRQPNVIVILVDDMGYGDPGCFNAASKIRTPHIDRMAAQGMRFTDAHAPGPLCHMSRYGLMTGRYPFRAPVEKWRTQPVIRAERVTLAGMLKQQGYRTAMVGKWHLGFAEAGYDQALVGGPADRGFDSFFGIRASTDIPPYFYIQGKHALAAPTEPIAANSSDGWSPIQGEFWRSGRIAPGMQLADVLPRFTEQAEQVISGHQSGDPLFLYLAYPAPHTPWLPSSDFAGKSQVGMYGDFVEMVDAMIGRVLSAVEKSGMAQNTLLFITSDNGPVWYQVDVERFQHDSCGPLRGMKADAWEAGHRMPLIAHWPGVVSPGSTSDALICFTDLFATLATITGYELQPQDGPDSFDFSDILYGSQTAGTDPRTEWVMRSGRGLMTMRQGNWKLIDGQGSGGFTKSPRNGKPSEEASVQLYHLGQDPGETTNLASTDPNRVQQMKARMEEIQNASSHRP